MLTYFWPELHLQRDSSPKTDYKAQHLEFLSKHFWKYCDRKTVNSRRTVWSFTTESRVWYEQDFTVTGLDLCLSFTNATSWLQHKYSCNHVPDPHDACWHREAVKPIGNTTKSILS